MTKLHSFNNSIIRGQEFEPWLSLLKILEDINQLSYEALDYYGAACQKKINKYWVPFSFMSSHGIRSNHLNDYGFCYFNLSKCFFFFRNDSIQSSLSIYNYFIGVCNSTVLYILDYFKKKFLKDSPKTLALDFKSKCLWILWELQNY